MAPDDAPKPTLRSPTAATSDGELSRMAVKRSANPRTRGSTRSWHEWA